jgi:hypothetical protein
MTDVEGRFEKQDLVDRANVMSQHSDYFQLLLNSKTAIPKRR